MCKDTGKPSRCVEADWPGKSGTSGVDRSVDAAGAELSNPADWLARALGSSASKTAYRVKRLSRQYARGRYEVDPSAVSKAILEEMLAAGHEVSGT
jgi:anti-sigma28 factor (negative regulator of flagellin synthesis)